MNLQELREIILNRSTLEKLCTGINGECNILTEDDEKLYAMIADIVGQVGVFKNKETAFDYVEKTLLNNLDDILYWFNDTNKASSQFDWYSDEEVGSVFHIGADGRCTAGVGSRVRVTLKKYPPKNSQLYSCVEVDNGYGMFVARVTIL